MSLARAVFLLVPFLIGTARAAEAKDFAGLVDIGGGRKIYLECRGSGSPTVVLVSGLRGSAGDWSIATKPGPRVFPDIAKFTRVCAYDRPGTPVGEGPSRSDPVPMPRTAKDAVADLHALLEAAAIPSPYVLVGHSFGGAYMELFAKAYPEDVEGVVLVDPRHRDFTTACQEAGLEGCVIPASVVASLPQVQADEFEAFAHTSEEMGALGAFGPYPVRVLTATVHGFTPELEALWVSMLGSLADEAADGDQSLFVGAGHFLQVERAHEVAQVILSLLPAPER